MWAFSGALIYQLLLVILVNNVISESLNILNI